MLTTPPSGPPAPASLPSARRFGRRINRIPAIIFCVVVAIVGVAVIYTIYLRGESTRHQREGLAHPASADASGFLKDKSSGFIAPSTFQTMPMQNTKEPPPETKEKAKEEKKEEADDNGLEKARQDAWKRHWKEYADLREDRFKKRFAALSAVDTSVKIPSEGHSGGEPQQASTTPAEAPANGSMGGYSGFSGGGWGGGGYPGFGGFPGLGPTPQIDRQGQEQKIKFANQQGNLKDDTVRSVRQPPDRFALPSGSFVKFAWMNESNSDVPGSQIGRVTESAYNNDGSCVLIPQGSTLIGKYNTIVSAGQDRLPGVLTKIVYPDGSEQQIGAMEVADNRGSAGQEDLLNRHIPEKFVGAFAAGLFGAAVQLSFPHNNGINGYDSQQIIASSIGQQMGQLGQQIAQQALSIPNTIKIRAGWEGTMITDRRIHIEPPWSCDGTRRTSILPIMSVN